MIDCLERRGQVNRAVIREYKNYARRASKSSNRTLIDFINEFYFLILKKKSRRFLFARR